MGSGGQPGRQGSQAHDREFAHDGQVPGFCSGDDRVGQDRLARPAHFPHCGRGLRAVRHTDHHRPAQQGHGPGHRTDAAVPAQGQAAQVLLRHPGFDAATDLRQLREFSGCGSFLLPALSDQPTAGCLRPGQDPPPTVAAPAYRQESGFSEQEAHTGESQTQTAGAALIGFI
ncbi:hypothetical protein DESC_830105 [Desulfosarcina cetonica]|nr:hypothetical protein DESC_830105 [Desulfosarcina cetonica]